ncbi:hypothetical protein KFL_003680020 [Klebsormidium nitens]|uniref:Uncharacterized protein n=1 Tax=Klebsormidium nitens TaxID=105231 RepID=A0A1Y1ICF8_KLENI|nr:hypothetical protein KFL_003680020 [Klebsormidium nitens]|eukprot:GAQ87652.1 hypothetical protein KFL_003680020 [Klebsormidium nitens]
MARKSKARGGPHVTVSWRRPGSNKWQKFEDRVGRAILAASMSGQATFQLDEYVRRSPRLISKQRDVTADRVRASRRSRKKAKHENLVLTLRTSQDGSDPASNVSGRAVRWGFSSTCTFDRLPNTARALAEMIAKCEAAKKRQVLSELLNNATSEDRISRFLSETDFSQPVQWYSQSEPVTRTGTLRVSQVAVNERARPGGGLYERFLDAMAGHVSKLGGRSPWIPPGFDKKEQCSTVIEQGGALRSLMGCDRHIMAPLTFAFHGTPPPNVPSNLGTRNAAGKEGSRRRLVWDVAIH